MPADRWVQFDGYCQFIELHAMRQIGRLRVVTPERRDLPPDLFLSLGQVAEEHGKPGLRKNIRDSESSSGRDLCTAMVHEIFGKSEPFKIMDHGIQSKPTAQLGDRVLEISISHTKGLTGCAVSENRTVGLDLEHEGRKVSSGLVERIRCRRNPGCEPEIDAIRCWTIKEAVLKWSGTGLRSPMSEVVITRMGDEAFKAVAPGGEEVYVISFIFERYWVALAYDDPEKGGVL
ncbi:MAG: 4'-phosphopantetheinyl transferase superfamily protein [Balneolaceae bacterium]